MLLVDSMHEKQEDKGGRARGGQEKGKRTARGRDEGKRKARGGQEEGKKRVALTACPGRTGRNNGNRSLEWRDPPGETTQVFQECSKSVARVL
jgi:hypothetical protein